MANEVVITITAEDMTAETRGQIVTNWKQTVQQIGDMPLVFKAVDDTAQARQSIEKAWYELADVVSNTPMVFQAEDGTKDARLQVEEMYLELAEAIEAQPVEFTAIDNTGIARTAIEAEYNAMVDATEMRPLAVHAVDDVQPVVEQIKAEVQELAAEVKATPIEISGPFNNPSDQPGYWQQMRSGSASGGGDMYGSAAASIAELEQTASPMATVMAGLAEAETEAGAAAQVLAAGEKEATASTSLFAEASALLSAEMGPLWMAINVAQMAMFAFGQGSKSTSTSTQDLASQVDELTAQLSKVGGTSAIQSLTGIGKATQQQADAAVMADAANKPYFQNIGVTLPQLLQAAGVSQKQFTDAVEKGGNSASYVSSALDDYVNHLQQIDSSGGTTTDTQHKLAQAASSLAGDVSNLASTWGAAGVTIDNASSDLAAAGYAMSDQQQAVNSQGLALQSLAKDFDDATAGAKYLEDSQDQATIAAGQAVQNWQQLQQAVSSARDAYQQAAEGVASAEHSVETAAQGVASAQHSEQQAVLATANAQHSYTDALYQEQQAQAAVTAARAAAEQQLISLQLSANDAAASVESANLSLFNAQQAAAALGVNPGNAQQIAGEQITAINEKQVAAAIALIQAENQVADSQNSSSQAQSSLNSARQQGVDNNPQVLSAEHSLEQAQYATQQAAEGVTNAHNAQQQAAIQVTNAEWSLQQASLAVGQAERAENQAAEALTTARDNASRSTDQNTLAGAQNRQMLENIFEAEVKATGSEQIAAGITQQFGQQMGFTSGQIGDVIGSLNGLNGMNSQFSITGTPSLNPQQLTQVGQELGMNFAQIEAVLPTQNVGRARAAGGPGGGLTWVGEDGPELVTLPDGAEVLPHANAMQHAALGLVRAPGHAVGGPVSAASALGANLPVAAQWGAYDVVGQMLHALGGPAVTLPPAGSVDMGVYGGYSSGGGAPASGGVEAAAQAYAASQLGRYGWGPDQMAPLIALWNQESGWNPNAVNASSGAYGIPQALGHGHPYDLGDYIGQVDWGLGYIGDRYGSPAAAEAHEQAFHWYAGGGPVGEDGWIGVGDDGPELLRVPGGSSVRPAANRGTAVADRVHVDVEFRFTGATDSGFATYFQRQVRENKIQLNVNGQRVKAGG